MPYYVRPAPKFHSCMTLAALAVVVLSLAASAHAQDLTPSTYISFDAPRAGTGAGQGTFPVAINQRGGIVGSVIDGSNLPHGFLRLGSGAALTVEPPKAVSSGVNAVNGLDYAVGSFRDAKGNNHGFLFTGSKYTQLDAPGADSVTGPTGINDKGQVCGIASSAGGTQNHGFLWDAQNQFTLFDVPGGVGATLPVAINASGVILGLYFDSSFATHAFIRSPTGAITTFDAGVDGGPTRPTAINDAGGITGSWDNGIGFTFGFLRGVPGGGALFAISGGNGNIGTGINKNGVVVGYNFSDFSNEAFVRDQFGNIAPILLPFANTSSTAFGINRGGSVTGAYLDSAGVSHGWVGVQ